jgi:hypothetical protein
VYDVSVKQMHVNMKLPRDLVKSVDTFAKHQAAETGVNYTRTDAVRHLLTHALAHLGKAAKK